MEIEMLVNVDIDVLCNEATQYELKYLAQSAIDFLGDTEGGQVIEDNLEKVTDEVLIEELEKRNYKIEEQ